MTPPAEVRERLLTAAVTLVREQGLPKLTQPRVAKAAGVSQSHLTYYFPTRADLLHAVLKRAAERQRAGIEAAVAAADTGVAALASQLAKTLSRPENTRVLVSFVLAADADPSALAMFAGLAGGMRATIAEMLEKVGIAPSPHTVTMVHALGTGLAILELALARSAARPNTAATLRELLQLLAERHPPSAKDPGGSS
jgi:AcrR family transcriptional regulator